MKNKINELLHSKNNVLVIGNSIIESYEDIKKNTRNENIWFFYVGTQKNSKDFAVKNNNVIFMNEKKELSENQLEIITGSELIIFDYNSFLFFETIIKFSKPYTQIAIYADLNEKLTEFDFYSTIHFKNLELIFV